MFQIDAYGIGWLDTIRDSRDDPCLHGYAAARIGGRLLAYDATVSATALYLLKTLTEDHLIYEDNQLLPCCGFSVYPDQSGENVVIIGCPNGVDWTVLHEGSMVRLILEDGTETVISLADYTKEVLRFVESIEAYYRASPAKSEMENELDREGWQLFWEEWHRRRSAAETALCAMQDGERHGKTDKA